MEPRPLLRQLRLRFDRRPGRTLPHERGEQRVHVAVVAIVELAQVLQRTSGRQFFIGRFRA